jgi:peptide/nickel transport system substrate-binding protein
MSSFSSLGIVFLIFICWIGVGCQKESPERPAWNGKQPVRGGSLRIAAQLPESLDPIHSKNYWESEIVLQLFDGLLRFDKDLNTAPALAQDWHVSPDGKTYTFNLRAGARFHNGRAITADDFVYTLTRLLDPKWNSADAQHYAKIQGAAAFRLGRTATVSGLKAVNPVTLQILLEQPYAPFLRVLAQQPAFVVPREEVERVGTDFGRHPVGSGAFRLEKWDGGTEILLSANSDHYEGSPYLNEVRITAVPALNAMESFQLFADGKLDLSFVPTEQIPVAQDRTDWVFLSRPILRLMYLGINLRDELLQNRKVRLAVAASVNKSHVLGQDLDYTITHSLIPFSVLGSDPARYADTYDLEAARRALKQVRWKSPRVQVKLWHARVSESRNQLLARLADDLRATGFEVELKLVASMGQLLNAIDTGKTQLFLLGEQMDFPDPDALLSRLFHSKSPSNPFGYRNPRVDSMLVEAQATLDDDQRAKLYAEIETQILDDHPILPLFLVKYSFVHHRRLQGLDLTPLGFQYLPFRSVWFQPTQ